MTYRELLYKATRLIDNNKITLGEYEEMTKPLDREVEQEPFINKPCVSSEVCEHDKNKVLDKLRAEIAELSHYYPMGHDYQIAITRCLAVIDKYKAESEDNNE